MSRLTISNEIELHEAFDSLGVSVGPRCGPGRRTKGQKEWYCLRLYLLTLAGHNRLKYPMDINKSERPDFLIDALRGRHGIEVTEATEQDWQRELTVSEVSADNDSVDAELIVSDGFVGEQPEHDWCATVIRAINKKITNLSDPSYQVTSCDLLIYMNSRTSIIADESRAIELLAKVSLPEKQRWRACAPLGCVAVLTNQYLLIDLLSGGEVLPITV